MPLTMTSQCASDLALDELLGEVLEAPARDRIETHLRDCLRCQLRKALLEQEHATFLARAPSLAAHTKLIGGTRRRRPARLGFLAVTAAAAAAAVVWIAPELQPRAAREAAGVRTKGSASVSFFIKRGESVQRGSSGATVHPGDRLRFTYSSDRSVYFALLNRDPRGTRVYFPWGPTAVQLAAARDHALDFSVELDESLGPERVYAVFCTHDFEVARLRAQLEASSELSAPDGCELEVVRLHKEPAR